MLEELIAFTVAAVLVALAPGPSTVVIMRSSMRSGRRAGAATMLGNETGVVLWGLAAALGLSALLAASRLAYDGMRIAGAAVLVYFGVRALWQARLNAPHQDQVGEEPGSLGRCFRLGLVTNFANPKAGVFAVSFLPQFVPDGVLVLPALVVLSVLWAVDAARRVFARPGVRRCLEQVSGVVLVGLGVRLAAETR